MAKMATSTEFIGRQIFKLPAKENIKWYPGHMNKSFLLMQKKIKEVDCVVEVHDARVPFSGRNPHFVKRLVGPKPHILVMNKVDLITSGTKKWIKEKLLEEAVPNVLFTSCRDQKCKGLKDLTHMAINLIRQSERYHRTEELKFQMMVIGVPNVGKSSIINALRGINLHLGKANPVGALAGVTRAVQNEVKINLNPPMYLVDTPGILPPNIKDEETGMKLALCACLRDDVVGPELIADYLLYWLNKQQNYTYVKLFQLSGPTNDIVPVLVTIALNLKKTKRIRNIETNTVEIIPDLHYAANYMVRCFRNLELGKLSLDYGYDASIGARTRQSA